MKQVEPEEVGMSGERLQHLSALVDSWVRGGHMQGASYVIARCGGIVAHKAFGLASDEPEPVPVTEETIFGIASLSKIALATAVLTLIDRGELLLGDSIDYLLPDFSSGGKGVITVRQLLTHTSGLGFFPDYYTSRDLTAYEASEEQWKQAVRETPVVFKPGTAVQYSPGFGPNLLKWIAEKVSGLEIEELCQKTIFRPLGMKDTSWRPPRDVWSRIAKLTAAGYPASLANSEYARTRLTAVWGSLFSTPEDIAKLLQTYLNGGELEGYRLLSPATVSLATRCHTDSLPFNPAAPGDMGLLFAVRGHRSHGVWSLPPIMDATWGDMTSASTFGFMGGDYTWGWADPERELIGVLFCNTGARLDPVRNLERTRHKAIFANEAIASLLED